MGTYNDSDCTASGNCDFTVTFNGTSANCTTCTLLDGTVSWTVRIPPPRKLLVKVPRGWKKGRVDGFVKLVNEQTRTGWRATMLVRVQKVYDPSIEQLTMKQFRSLLLQTASAGDAAVINAFFIA